LVDSDGDINITTPAYWLKHTRDAVRFYDGIQTLIADGFSNFIEIGPHPVLLAMTQEAVDIYLESQADAENTNQELTMLPSMRKGSNAWQELLTSVGKLFVKGVEIDWKGFDKDYIRQKVQLPTYPFQRQRYWVDDCRQIYYDMANLKHPLLVKQIDFAKEDTIAFEAFLDTKKTTVLQEHKVYDVAVLPAVAYIEMVVAAVRRAVNLDVAVELSDIGFERAIAVLDGAAVKLQVSLLESNGQYNIDVYSKLSGAESDWHLNLTGSAIILNNNDYVKNINTEEIIRGSFNDFDANEFFSKIVDLGMNFGPRFKSLQHIWLGQEEALGRVELNADFKDEVFLYEIYPPLLDSGLQLLASCLPFRHKAGLAHLPVGVEKLVCYSHPTSHGWVYATWQDSGETSESISHRGNVKLLNDNGDVVVDITGITFVEAPANTVLQDVKKYNTSDFYNVSWEQQARDSKNINDDILQLVVIGNHQGIGDSVIAEIKSQNININTVKVTYGGAFNHTGGEEYILNIQALKDYKMFLKILANDEASFLKTRFLILAPLDCCVIDESLDENQTLGLINQNHHFSYLTLLYLSKALLEVHQELSLSEPNKIYVVVSGSDLDSVEYNPIELWQSEVRGLKRALGMEVPGLGVKLLYIDANLEQAASSDIAQKLLYEINSDDNETEIMLTTDAERRFVARLNHCNVNTEVYEYIFKENASYLITGGLGALGIILTGWMLRHGAKNIVLISRGAPSDDVLKNIHELENKFGAKISLAQLDIADMEAIQAWYNQQEVLRDLPIKGVFHAAGLLEDALLSEQSFATFEKVARPKVLGAWCLHKITQGLELDFFVLFSSQTSMLGNIGQVN
jgi:hypothetical protein